MITGDLKQVADILAEGVSGGGGTARASLGAGASFADLDGTIPTVANFASHMSSSGMSVPVLFARESGTPAAITAESATKNSAVVLSQTTQSLKKFAGLASMTLEATLSADDVASAVASTLNGSVLRSFEADAVASVTTGAGTTLAAPADWVTGIAAAQGVIYAAGGRPSVIVVPAVDWGEFAGDVLGTSAFSQDPGSPVGALLGTPIHISTTAPTGTALVFDAAAVQVVTHEASPLVVLDAASQADQNVMRIVVDVVASTFVSSPAKVVAVPEPAAP